MPNQETLDQYRNEIEADIRKTSQALRHAKARRDELKAEAKEAAANVDKLEEQLFNQSQNLVDLSNGQYQPDLFDKNGDSDLESENRKSHPDLESPDAVAGTPALAAAAKIQRDLDTGAPLQLSLLTGFGITDKMVEAIQASELAKSFNDLATIQDLERAIGADEWWHRKIKGIGKTKVDKVIDAITAFRAAHPAKRDENDERAKQCLSLECGATYSQNFVQCPKCGGTTFQLVDAPDKMPGFDADEDGSEETADANAETVAANAETAEAPLADIEATDSSDGPAPTHTPCNDPAGASPFSPDQLRPYSLPETGSGPIRGTNIRIVAVSAQDLESGYWHACCGWVVDGKLHGRSAPTTTSPGSLSEDEALILAIDEMLDWFEGHDPQPEQFGPALNEVEEFRTNCAESLRRSME